VFLSWWHKILYVCNVVLFGIGFGCFCAGVCGWVAASVHADLSIRSIGIVFGAATFAFVLAKGSLVFSSICRTRDADYIHRLHQARAGYAVRVSAVGVIGLSLIFGTILVLLMVWGE